MSVYKTPKGPVRFTDPLGAGQEKKGKIQDWFLFLLVFFLFFILEGGDGGTGWRLDFSLSLWC